MNGDEIRQVLKKICKLASKKVFTKLNFKINFDDALYVLKGNPNEPSVILCVYANMNILDQAHNQIRLNPKFNFNVSSNMILSDINDDSSNHPIINLQIYHPYSTRLPIIDKFSYKFSNAELEMILHALMSNRICLIYYETRLNYENVFIQVIPSCKNVEELMMILDMSLVE